MSIEAFKEMVMAFPGTEANLHFDRVAFRMTKKRIFATLHEPSQSINIVLTPAEQGAFCQDTAGAVYPVSNKWGLQGWTTFELENVSPELVQAALELAYQAILEQKKKR